MQSCTPDSHADSRPSAQEILRRAWVIIPAFNEATCIREVACSVRTMCPNLVVIDDGSSDDTAVCASQVASVVLRHVINLGQGAAIATGLQYVLSRGAEFIFTFDADGQHSPDALRTLATWMADSDCDVVLGSRWLGRAENVPLGRRLLLQCAVAFTRIQTGLSISDTHNGLRLFKASAARRLRLEQPRMAHASELLNRISELGLRWIEAPVTVRYSSYSLKKGQTFREVFQILADLLGNWISR